MKKEANYPLGEDAKSDWYCELMIVRKGRKVTRCNTLERKQV